MSLTVWALISRDNLRRQISRALKPLGPGKLVLIFLRSGEQIESMLHRLWTDPVSRFPDLLIAEKAPAWDDGTELLTHLRTYQSLDYLPVLEHPTLEKLLKVRSFGAFDILSQPFQDRRLLESIRHLIQSREYLSQKTTYPQRSIDAYLRLFTPEVENPDLQILKDASYRTKLQKLHRLIRQYPEGLSAADIAGLAHVSVTTVRTCLKTLEETDLVRKESIHQGRSGRPLYIYYPSERRTP